MIKIIIALMLFIGTANALGENNTSIIGPLGLVDKDFDVQFYTDNQVFLAFYRIDSEWKEMFSPSGVEYASGLYTRQANLSDFKSSGDYLLEIKYQDYPDGIWHEMNQIITIDRGAAPPTTASLTIYVQDYDGNVIREVLINGNKKLSPVKYEVKLGTEWTYTIKAEGYQDYNLLFIADKNKEELVILEKFIPTPTPVPTPVPTEIILYTPTPIPTDNKGAPAVNLIAPSTEEEDDNNYIVIILAVLAGIIIIILLVWKRISKLQ